MDAFYLQHAIELARHHSRSGVNGPFGALVVSHGQIVGEGWNRVVEKNDPTAHAEIVAIRAACRQLASFDLPQAVLYASCEPCPMCMAAIYWARIPKVVYACSRDDAADIGFDDARIYDQIAQPPQDRQIEMIQSLAQEGRDVFAQWCRNPRRIMY